MLLWGRAQSTRLMDNNSWKIKGPIFTRGKVRNSTLEFKGVHVTKSTVFVTDSKSIYTFSVTSTVLIPDFLSKTVEVAF